MPTDHCAIKEETIENNTYFKLYLSDGTCKLRDFSVSSQFVNLILCSLN